MSDTPFGETALAVASGRAARPAGPPADPRSPRRPRASRPKPIVVTADVATATNLFD